MKGLLKVTALTLATMIACSSASFAFDNGSGSESDRQACTPDVFRLCMSEIPNADAIVVCLKANKKNLSPACKKVMFPKG